MSIPIAHVESPNWYSSKADTLYVPEPIWGVPRLAPVLGHLRLLQDLCSTLGIPFLEFPNPANSENSNDE